MHHTRSALLNGLAVVVLAAPAANADWVTDTLPAGQNPCAVSVNPLSGMAYIANSGSNSITVINMSTSTVTATIPVDPGPCALAVNPLANKIYAACRAGNSVTVIDGGTNRTSTIAAGSGPSAVAINGTTGCIYVANKTGNSVTVINGTTGETSTVAVGNSPLAIAVNPVTNRIYTADSGSNSVTEINGATNDTTVIATGSGPCAVAVNTAANKIYAANRNDNTVTVIDGVTRTAAMVAAGNNPCAVAVNSLTGKIYVANRGSNNVTVINGATNGTSTLAAGAAPAVVAINPATGKVYVANSSDTTITVINGTTNGLSKVTVPTGSAALAVNPVMNKIIIAKSGSATALLIDGTSNDTTSLTTNAKPCFVAVNPVTNKLYIANDNNTLTVIECATNRRSTVFIDSLPLQVAVNPVTNKIYVTHAGPRSADGSISSSVSVIDGTTNKVMKLQNIYMYPDGLTINPVSNKIYVTGKSCGYFMVIDGATDSVTTILTDGDNAYSLAVNPATNRIYLPNVSKNYVTVIDGATNQFSKIFISAESHFIAVNPVTNKIYVTHEENPWITVIDGASNAFTRIPLKDYALVIAVNQITNRIYATNYSAETVTVIDGVTNTTVTVPSKIFHPGNIAINPVSNKIYITTSIGSGIAIIDGITNSLITVPSKSTWFVAVNPVTGTVYNNDYSDDVSVISAAPVIDTLLTCTIETPSNCITYEARPVVAGYAVNRFSTGRTGLAGICSRFGSSQGPWTWSSMTSGAGSDSANWAWQWGNDSLIMGENYLCILPVDSQLATANNLGAGTPSIGIPTVFPIYRLEVMPTSAPALLSPPDSATGNSLPVVFSWNTVPGATYYCLQISFSRDFHDLHYSSRIFGNSYAASLEGSRTCFWRVNAANGGGASSWSPTRQYTPISPEAPKIVNPPPSPSSNDYQPLPVSLIWTKVSAAERYILQLGTNPTFADSVLILDTVTTDTFRVITGLSYNMTYFWRIKAKSASGAISGWPLGYFSTLTTPSAAPALIAPVNIDTAVPVPVTLVWSPVDPAADYLVQVATDTAFTSVLFQDSSVADTFVVFLPEFRTTCFWRVRAKNAAGAGPWSNVNVFTTGTSTQLLTSRLPPDKFSITGTRTAVRYSLPQQCRVSLKLYDLSGRLAATLVNSVQNPGWYQFSPKMSTITRGTYIRVFIAGSFVQRSIVPYY